MDASTTGAGLYSFFMVSRDCLISFADVSNAGIETQNYCQDCIQTRNCQEQILNIDSCSSCVYIYSLSTVATAYQVSVDGKGIIGEKDNVNGFGSTVTVWKAHE